MIGKLKKYNDIQHYNNVIECKILDHDPVQLSCYWQDFPAVDRPITLELGCGKGEYTLSLARKYPERFFIGVDIKGARIWKGAGTALHEQLPNVLFLRMRIEHLAHFFKTQTISEIWITFPDPHSKKNNKNSHKRLTSQQFLNLYKQILSPSGIVHLKTDNELLFDFTRKTVKTISARIIEQSSDLYNSPITDDPVEFQTTFEKRYLHEHKPIRYLCFSFDLPRVSPVQYDP